jgi:hypothetical protein
MSKWISIRLGSLIKINYGKDHKSLLNGDIPVYGRKNLDSLSE